MAYVFAVRTSPTCGSSLLSCPTLKPIVRATVTSISLSVLPPCLCDFLFILSSVGFVGERDVVHFDCGPGSSPAPQPLLSAFPPCCRHAWLRLWHPSPARATSFTACVARVLNLLLIAATSSIASFVPAARYSRTSSPDFGANKTPRAAPIPRPTAKPTKGCVDLTLLMSFLLLGFQSASLERFSRRVPYVTRTIN